MIYKPRLILKSKIRRYLLQQAISPTFTLHDPLIFHKISRIKDEIMSCSYIWFSVETSNKSKEMDSNFNIWDTYIFISLAFFPTLLLS